MRSEPRRSIASQAVIPAGLATSDRYASLARSTHGSAVRLRSQTFPGVS